MCRIQQNGNTSMLVYYVLENNVVQLLQHNANVYCSYVENTVKTTRSPSVEASFVKSNYHPGVNDKNSLTYHLSKRFKVNTF